MSDSVSGSQHSSPSSSVSGEWEQQRGPLKARVEALIDRLADGSRDDGARDRLLSELLFAQSRAVSPYARLFRRRARPEPGAPPSAWPALPTEVFRYARVSARPEERDRALFLTSGTTSGRRGAHPFSDLSLYERAAEAAARHALFVGLSRPPLLFLAPSPARAPQSSLSHMLGLFAERLGGEACWAFEGEDLDANLIQDFLIKHEENSSPVFVLGTSFAFVFAEEKLDRAYRLPAGSRIMQTGGFKGRTKEVAPEAMRATLAARYGLPERAIVAEYGMTELSSQLYEDVLLEGGSVEGGSVEGERALWVPGWVRASVVDPETLRELPEGELGLLRLDDLANLDSVAAVQTSDLARRRGARIHLLGRAPGAVPRGCSLAVEEVLGGEVLGGLGEQGPW